MGINERGPHLHEGCKPPPPLTPPLPPKVLIYIRKSASPMHWDMISANDDSI